MTQSSFEVNGRQYRASRMSAMDQLHVARRITPLLVGLIPAMTEQLRAQAAQKAEAGEGGEPVSLMNLNIKSLLPGLQSAAQLLSDMSESEFEFVMEKCLSLVQVSRNGDTGWANVWNRAARQLQFDDISGADVLMIMAEVLKAELTPFMSGLLSAL